MPWPPIVHINSQHYRIIPDKSHLAFQEPLSQQKGFSEHPSGRILDVIKITIKFAIFGQIVKNVFIEIFLKLKKCSDVLNSEFLSFFPQS